MPVAPPVLSEGVPAVGGASLGNTGMVAVGGGALVGAGGVGLANGGGGTVGGRPITAAEVAVGGKTEVALGIALLPGGVLVGKPGGSGVKLGKIVGISVGNPPPPSVGCGPGIGSVGTSVGAA